MPNIWKYNWAKQIRYVVAHVTRMVFDMNFHYYFQQVGISSTLETMQKIIGIKKERETYFMIECVVRNLQ